MESYEFNEVLKNRHDNLYLYRLETVDIVCFKQIKTV